MRLAVCVVAGLKDGKLTHEHIYWDRAGLLVQVGLLDPAGLPVVGAEQAEKLLAPRSIPANALLGADDWRRRLAQSRLTNTLAPPPRQRPYLD